MHRIPSFLLFYCKNSMEYEIIFIFHPLQSASSEDNIEGVPGHLYLMARYGSGNYYNKLLPAGTAVNVAPLLSTWKIAATHSTTHRLDESSYASEALSPCAEKRKEFHLFYRTICRILTSSRSY